MQKVERAGEPTMEEILASIRQIISEEPSGSRPSIPAPPPPTPSAPTTQASVAPPPPPSVSPSVTSAPIAKAAGQDPAAPREPRLAPQATASATKLGGGEAIPLPLSKLSSELPAALRQGETPRTASPSQPPPPQHQPAVVGPMDKPLPGASDLGTFVPRRGEDRSTAVPVAREAAQGLREQVTRELGARAAHLPSEALGAAPTPPPAPRREMPEAGSGALGHGPMARPPHAHGPVVGVAPHGGVPTPQPKPMPAPTSTPVVQAGALPGATPMKAVVTMVPSAARDDAPPSRPDSSPQPTSVSSPSSPPLPSRSIDQLLARSPLPPTFNGSAPTPPAATPPVASQTVASHPVASSLETTTAPAATVSPAPVAADPALAAPVVPTKEPAAPTASAVVALTPSPADVRKAAPPAVRTDMSLPVKREATDLAAVVPQPVKTLEDTVVDLLRPMLRTWLDENMPRIVEKALRVELSEQLKGPVSPKKD